MSESVLQTKIMEFLADKKEYTELNPFLKSLFPPKPDEPPKYLDRTVNKQLRYAISTLANQGKISVLADTHMKLGMHHYPDDKTGKQEHHNVGTLKVIARSLV